jgi:hypothetical protein
LVDAIDAALERGLLRPLFHELAHEVREYGNLGAHPDDEQLANANAESARQILEFPVTLHRGAPSPRSHCSSSSPGPVHSDGT